MKCMNLYLKKLLLFNHIIFGLKGLCFMSLTSCTSLYLEEFDSSVHEGVKNYSLTDLERSLVETPGNQQDILMIVPKPYETVACSQSLNKVWICQQTDDFGHLEQGHYQVLSEERIHAID